MKKLIFTILSSSMIASSAFAYETLDLTKLISKNMKEVKLLDGRKIDFQKEVERLHLYDSKIDYLELLNGEIIDRTDIQSVRFLHADKLMMARTGVDGGG